MSEIEFLGSGSMSEPISFVSMYSDGTPMVKTPGWARIVDQADTVVLRPRSLNDFVVAMFLVDSVNLSGGDVNRLILPYVPGARQDRVNPTGDVLSTAKSVATMINDRFFSRVVILDPHSPVIKDSIANVVEYPLENVIKSIPSKYDGVIAPDKGAVDRAQRASEALGSDVQVKYGSKVRDVSTGRLKGFKVDSLDAGKHYLVSDDICDGGGTFIGLGEKIREQGATADLFVSHGIFSKGTDGLRKIYTDIYTTDSLNRHERNRVTILPVVREMENYNG